MARRQAAQTPLLRSQLLLQSALRSLAVPALGAYSAIVQKANPLLAWPVIAAPAPLGVRNSRPSGRQKRRPSTVSTTLHEQSAP